MLNGEPFWKERRVVTNISLYNWIHMNRTFSRGGTGKQSGEGCTSPDTISEKLPHLACTQNLPIESHLSAERGLHKRQHTICIDGIQAEKTLPAVREVTVKGPLKLGYQALQCPRSHSHITIATRGSQKTPHFTITQWRYVCHRHKQHTQGRRTDFAAWSHVT